MNKLLLLTLLAAGLIAGYKPWKGDEPKPSEEVATVYWSPDKYFAKVQRDSQGNRVDQSA